jgi:hypothetical protein
MQFTGPEGRDFMGGFVNTAGTITRITDADTALAAWSTDDPAAVAAAEATFNKLKRHGPVHKVLPGGGLHHVRDFDPAASYVAVGPLAGG